MRNILVLGAGQSASYLVHRLLADAADEDWFVTVGDRDRELAQTVVGDHPRGGAIGFDVADAETTETQIERAEVVVNFLPQRLQPTLSGACLRTGRHMVSVSYRDRDMEELDAEAQRKGVLLLTEIGLDPGIDLMSAAQLIQRIQAEGGCIEHFESYGSGVPAHEAATNPLRYAITWNPRNVAMAGEAGAQWIEDGRVRILPWHRLFQYPWPKDVPGFGAMEAYPNRDSLGYRDLLGLHDASTLIRGTLRYPGFCETWAQIVELGLPNEQLVIPDLESLSWAQLVEMFLPTGVTGKTLEARVANHLRISPTGSIMEKLRWLGLFSPEPAGFEGRTAAHALIHLLRTRLPLEGRDAVILFHELIARFDEDGGRRERILSTFVAHGEHQGFTAMSRTVGLPAAIAVRLLLRGELPLTGCRIPNHPVIYDRILAELEHEGLRFEEETTIVA